ncbi:uncharacterized protein LOC129752419 [Uranotaenia lowii]|uniref:uncharacterized protein LOC129752419 n=1 Tax=Uranotaenia lowii TaxID=190385 RepID=UPI00247AA143|nr:uncharacterized protein LOC129752419 [Uranotaenia lowii]
MEALVRERKSLDSRLKRSIESLTRLQGSEETEELDIQTEIDNLQKIWNDYLLVHKRMIETCKDEEVDGILEHLENFESSFLVNKNRLLKLLKRVSFATSTRIQPSASQDGGDAIRVLVEQQAEFLRQMSISFAPVNPPSTSERPSQERPTIVTDLKLPRMTLPVFSGNILEWQSFYDLFDSAVHKNPALTDSQRLYFLKTNLEGEAATLLSHLRIEDANYAPALAKLKQRFNKPFDIAVQHIQRFINQPLLATTSADGLRSLHDISDESLRALQALNRNDRDIWLLYILTEKLDDDTKQLWCQKRSEMSDEDVTLETLLKFIDNQSIALKSIEATRPKSQLAVKQPSKHQFRNPPTLVATNQSASDNTCGFCSKSPHQLYQCACWINSADYMHVGVFSIEPHIPATSLENSANNFAYQQYRWTSSLAASQGHPDTQLKELSSHSAHDAPITKTPFPVLCWTE